MFNRIRGQNRDAFHPRVFGPPEALTETLFYRAMLRLPQPPLPSARGHATPMFIRTSTAAAGILSSYLDPHTGIRHYNVQYPNVPIDK